LDLTPESVGIMEKRCMAAGTDGFLFSGRMRGTPLSDVENGHKRVLEASGLAFVIYDLRHRADSPIMPNLPEKICLRAVWRGVPCLADRRKSA
jgi:hypothetical protein